MFDAALAERYERWYETPGGRRAEAAERQMLGDALHGLPPGARVLEVGCGTGRFSRWLTAEGYRVVGLDRSAAMLGIAQRTAPGPWLRGDAQALPLVDRAVDAIVLVTALEFVPEPLDALREAIRVARHRLAIVSLSAWSVAWRIRRWRGRESATIANARRWSPPAVVAAVREAASSRAVSVAWHTGLAPRGLPGVLPWGEIVAVTAHLAAGRLGHEPESSADGGKSCSASQRR